MVQRAFRVHFIDGGNKNGRWAPGTFRLPGCCKQKPIPLVFRRQVNSQPFSILRQIADAQFGKAGGKDHPGVFRGNFLLPAVGCPVLKMTGRIFQSVDGKPCRKIAVNGNAVLSGPVQGIKIDKTVMNDGCGGQCLDAGSDRAGPVQVVHRPVMGIFRRIILDPGDPVAGNFEVEGSWRSGKRPDDQKRYV